MITATINLSGLWWLVLIAIFGILCFWWLGRQKSEGIHDDLSDFERRVRVAKNLQTLIVVEAELKKLLYRECFNRHHLIRASTIFKELQQRKQQMVYGDS